jgi:hypothetical protein
MDKSLGAKDYVACWFIGGPLGNKLVDVPMAVRNTRALIFAPGATYEARSPLPTGVPVYSCYPRTQSSDVGDAWQALVDGAAPIAKDEECDFWEEDDSE